MPVVFLLGPSEVRHILADSEARIVVTAPEFVALKTGATADAATLIGFCQERLARYKCPKQVRFVDALPKSPIGKILRKELRSLA